MITIGFLLIYKIRTRNPSILHANKDVFHENLCLMRSGQVRSIDHYFPHQYKRSNNS